MVNARRMYVAIIAITLLVAGSTVAWLFLHNNMPKRTPLRARPVITGLCNFSDSPVESPGIKTELLYTL